MNKKPTPNYERIFWKLAFQYFPHHAFLFMTIKYGRGRLVRRLFRQGPRQLRVVDIKPFPPERLNKYIEAASHASIWHGTGRLQYREDKVIDTFQNILNAGALNPINDVYSMIITGKEMRSVSATRLRIIARSYADTHGLGVQEVGRYGSSLWWVAYYYNLCHVEIAVKHGFSMARNWAAFSKASTDSRGERTWGKKVNKKAKSVWDVFGLGSDIKDNYPILFGIKEEVGLAILPKSMQKWEVRIVTPVTFSAISHIEVPENRVDEVVGLLKRYGYKVPVFPIELGEFAASQELLTDLLYKNKDMYL